MIPSCWTSTYRKPFPPSGIVPSCKVLALDVESKTIEGSPAGPRAVSPKSTMRTTSTSGTTRPSIRRSSASVLPQRPALESSCRDLNQAQRPDVARQRTRNRGGKDSSPASIPPACRSLTLTGEDRPSPAVSPHRRCSTSWPALWRCGQSSDGQVRRATDPTPRRSRDCREQRQPSGFPSQPRPTRVLARRAAP